VHECGLTFENAGARRDGADVQVQTAHSLVDEVIRSKLSILLAPAVHELLKQGKHEPVIADILGCKGVQAVEAALAKHVTGGSDAVNIINKYLKKIVVLKVNLADFKPSATAVEKDAVQQVADEFRAFLRKQFSEGKSDTVEVLQLE